MGEGFGKLVEKLLEYWDRFLPFETIEHFNRGVRLRFGKAVVHRKGENKGKVKILLPGFHWKLSFADDILSHMVKAATLDLPRQFITTKDGKSILVSGVLKYDVDDVATLLLEVDGPKVAVGDLSLGYIRTVISKYTWDEMLAKDIDNEITIKIRKEAKKWGIRVEKLTLTDQMLITPSSILNLN